MAHIARPIRIDRLRKICGLLSSAHSGERAAAALKATEILRERGLAWEEIIALPSRSADAAMNLQAEALAMRAQADLFRTLLEHERERVNLLLREVDRLKGMWPMGKPRASKEAA